MEQHLDLCQLGPVIDHQQLVLDLHHEGCQAWDWQMELPERPGA